MLITVTVLRVNLARVLTWNEVVPCGRRRLYCYFHVLKRMSKMDFYFTA